MNTSQLRIVFRSSVFEDTISAIYSSQENIYLGFKNSCDIHVYYRISFLGCLKGHRHSVKGFLCLGSYLISWSDFEVFVWNLKSLSLYGIIKESNDILNERKISVILHPETYINKVIICYSTHSDVEFWNFSSLKLIHTFQSVYSLLKASCGITAICTTTDPDILGFGCKNGKIFLLDIQSDKILVHFENFPNTTVSVTSLTCCTDENNSKYGILACGCSNGDITFWNLYDNCLLYILESPHGIHAPITTLTAIEKEPLIVSASHSNSIILWVFDYHRNNELPRELRSRKGFCCPITSLEFYDPNGKDLLCSGYLDACFFGFISTFQQHQNSIFSQKKSLHKITQGWRKPLSHLTEMTCMAFTYSRHYDWPNILTCHKNLSSVFLWSAHDKILVSRTFNLPVEKRQVLKKSLVATAVAISRCGQYAVVGYHDGSLHKFNVQSGLYRGEFQSSVEKTHKGSVTQIEILSHHLVLSLCNTNNDCCLKGWDMRTCQWKYNILLKQYLKDYEMLQWNAIRFNCFNTLVAILLRSNDRQTDNSTKHSQNDMVSKEKLIVISLETFHLVRDVPTVENDIIHVFTTSSNGRWIVYATKYKPYLYVYDLLSNSLIDWIDFDSPVLCLTFDTSDTFLYLCLKHMNGCIYVMGNKFIFDVGQKHPVLNPTPQKPIKITECQTLSIQNQTCNDSLVPIKSSEMNNCFFSQKPLIQGFLTLSGMSFNKIESILYLDIIKNRNKIQNTTNKKNQLTKATDVPFFLPTMYEGNQLKFEKLETDATTDNISHFQKNSSDVSSLNVSELQKQLKLFKTHINPKIAHSILTNYFLKLSPSAIDLTLLNIGELAGGNHSDLIDMLDYFIASVYSRENVDFIQALLNVFMKKHSSSIIEILQTTEKDLLPCSELLYERLQKLRHIIKQDSEPFELQCHQMSSFFKFLTHTQF
ncbi:WD repeat-containing protein 36-like [Hylaeus volcanicus]|uniref:WD repeat-containing protein 36-like n=1 Tax=Hylaeus volcanicus TaxID=313075 RepID=UPI0023B7FEBF|nr:WD repeat-containing protein 36-like [Hylaeus volcanicus]